MTDQRFDKHIRDWLDHHESKVSDQVWSNVVNHLSARKKKRRFSIWMILSACALILLTAFGIYLGSALHSDHVSSSENGRVLISDQPSETNDQMISNEMNSSDRLEQNQLNKTSSIDQVHVNQTTNESVESAIEEDEKHTIQKFVSTESSADLSKKDIDKLHHVTQRPNVLPPKEIFKRESQNAITSVKENLSNHQIHIDSEVTSKDISLTDQLSSSEPNKNDLNADRSTLTEEPRQGIFQSAANTPEEINKVGLSVQPRLMALARYQAEAISPLAKRNARKRGFALGHGHLALDLCAIKGNSKKNRLHCYSYVQQNQRIFADFSLGPRISSRLMSSKTAEGQDLLEARNDTEKQIMGLNAAARIGIKLSSGWMGMAGLSYDRLFERFDYHNPNEISTTIITIVVDTIRNPVTGALDQITDTLNIRTVGERTIKHTNQMTRISIPVTVGHMWELEKIHIGVHAGALFNVYFTQSGRIINENGEPVSLSGETRESVFRMNAGVGLTGGVFLAYEFDKDWQVFVEPQFIYDLGSITNSDYRLTQRYLQTGLNVGLRTTLSETFSRKKKYGAR